MNNEKRYVIYPAEGELSEEMQYDDRKVLELKENMFPIITVG